MIRRPPRSTQSRSSAASDVYKRESHHKKIEKRIFDELDITITEKEREPYIGMASDELWGAVVQAYQLDHSPIDLFDLNNQRIIEYFKAMKNLEPIPGIKTVL